MDVNIIERRENVFSIKFAVLALTIEQFEKNTENLSGQTAEPTGELFV